MKKEKAKETEMSLAEKRLAQREQTRANLNKKFGSEASGLASLKTSRYIPRISTGSFDIDLAMGGGWPRGRINMAWGAWSGGKSSNFLRSLADAQKRDAITNQYIHLMSKKERKNSIGMTCAWIDVEGSFDREWAKKLGVDLAALEYSCPLSQEEACEMAEQYMLSGAFDCVFLDSIAAMSSEKEIEGAMGDHNIGVGARLNNKMFRKIQSAINRTVRDNVGILPTFFVINQERHKIGVTFGPSTTKPGGAGQDFFTSVVLHLSGNAVDYFDTEKKLPKSVDSYFKIDKNKTYPPKVRGKIKQALVDDPDGLFRAGEIIETKEVMLMAEREGIYAKEGATWRMFDNIYKRKSDLAAEWIADREKFLLLKGILLSRLLPHQAKDWRVSEDVAEEEKGTERSTSGDEKIKAP